MRNLKKILALVLALVMSMSLLTVANAFSDDEAIDETYREAATVLDGLKVLQGRDDGNFDPQALITRAEMAAIIYRMTTTDVTDAKKDIYAESCKLSDVNSTSWYAGYVGYAYNSTYIKGYSDGTFQPLKNVTGHEALAMLLRAMGYGKNGEFEGKDWAINTAAYAHANGLTKNINTGLLSQPATREMVAEMAFRALLAENVNWSLGLNYQPNGKTLAQGFGLEKIEGVITANEYADLYSNYAVAEGKTVLTTENGDRTLNCTSDLTMIGESRYAYVVGKDVLYIADNGNANYENAGAAVAKANKAAAEAGIAITADTEQYVNFGGDGDTFKSDVRIEFSVNFADADAKADFVANYADVDDVTGWESVSADKLSYKKVVRAEKTITALDLAVIRGIFAAADDSEETEGISGYVYVGSDSEDDVSDTMSYKKFYNEYIETVSEFENFNSADNGEWLKVIDNNQDGEAEYAFLTKFVMTSVADVNTKKDTYTFEGKETNTWSDTTDNDIDNDLVVAMDDVATEDELAVGDVILYTYIDGVYFVNKVTPVTETIDKKGIDYKAETIACGETTYEWSGVNYDARGLYHDVSEADTQVAYDLYLDHFGYVRLFIESAYNKGFVLLTDGYYKTDRRAEEFKAQIWDVDAADYEDVNVLNPDHEAEDFIDTNEGGDNGNRGTWARLIEAGKVYFGDNDTDGITTNDDPFWTNIAAFTASDDGYLLEKVQNASNRKDYDTAELNVNTATGKISVKEKDLKDANGDRVQATTETLYYFVTKNTTTGKIKSIETWVGYNNAPKTAVLGADAVAYAVTSVGLSGKYDVAEIVVFETSPALSSSVYFLNALSQKLIGNKFVEVHGLGYDGEKYGPVSREALVTGNPLLRSDFYYPVEIDDLMKFYTIDTAGNVERIDNQFNDSNIYAGYVTVAQNVKDRNYVEVTANGEDFHFYKDDNLGYTVTYSEKYAAQKDSFKVDGYTIDRVGNVVKTYGIESGERYSAAGVGDRVIFYTNNDGEIQYIINVDESTYYNTTSKTDEVAEGLDTLWDNIMADQGVERDLRLKSFKVKDVTINANGSTTLTNTQATDTSELVWEAEIVGNNNGNAYAVVYDMDAKALVADTASNTLSTGTYNWKVSLIDGDVTVDYIFKFEVKAASNEAGLNGITIKGVDVTPVGGADETGAADKPYRYTVTLTYGESVSDAVQLAIDKKDSKAELTAITANGSNLDTTPDAEAALTSTDAVTATNPGTVAYLEITAEDGTKKYYGIAITVDASANPLTLTVNVDNGASFKSDAGSTLTTGLKLSNTSDFVFTATPAADTHYIADVTFTTVGSNAMTKTITAVDGKFTISAADLAGATGLTIVANQLAKPVVTFTAGIAYIDGTDVANVKVMPGTTVTFQVLHGKSVTGGAKFVAEGGTFDTWKVENVTADVSITIGA